jgi:Mce-associated membrane protein
VEDQPADPGDLTADAASVPQGKAARNRHRLPRQKAQPSQPAEGDEAPEAEEAEEGEDGGASPVSSDVPQAAEDEVPGAVDEPVEDADDTERVLVPHRPAGRALKMIAVAASVAFVAAGAFAGASIAPYLADRAAVHTKFNIAETAANAITTLWTYTPEDMDKLPDRSARYLGGDFASDYKRYIDAIVAPNKQAQVTNNTQVLGAAVESLTPTEATAIVYTNSVATSPVTKGIPSLRYLSYRLTMKRQDDRWLITQMVAVTKLDLTPRL